MADPTTTTTPDFTGVVDQRFFMAPLGGPEHPISYLDRFPEDLYNKSIDSHLVRFMYALLGPAGIGWLRKNYLDARLKLEDFGIDLTDLDQFYADPVSFGRILEEIYEEDPSGLLPPDKWEALRAKDSKYRNRALDYVTGARAGGTPKGMALVARSGLGHEVEIFERYRYLYDQLTDDQIGIPNLGTSGSTEEMVVIPRRELPQSEIQTLTISGSPTGGTFTINFPLGDAVTNTTVPINYNADRFVVQAILEAIPSIKPGNISVSGGPLPGVPIEILFTGDLAYKDVPKLTANASSLTGGTAPAISIVTTRSGIDQADEVVNIPARDRYYLVSALSRIKPVTTIVTFEPGTGLTKRQNWVSTISSSTRHEVVRYVTGQGAIKWPTGGDNWIEARVEKVAPRGANDMTHAYQGFHNIANVMAYTEAALAENLLLNPSFEENVDHWYSDANNTMIRVDESVTGPLEEGNYACKLTANVSAAYALDMYHTLPVDCSAGEGVTGRVRLVDSSTSLTDQALVIDFYDVSGAYPPLMRVSAPISGNGVYTVNGVAPEGAVRCFVAVTSLSDAVVPAGDWVITDGWMLVKDPNYIGEYFDGDTSGCQWTGTPHASFSIDPNYGLGVTPVQANNEHIGNFTNYQIGLYPILGFYGPDQQHFADKAPADYAEPLTISNSTTSSEPTPLINGIYPSSYQTLEGVPQIKYKDDQFWSSVERAQGTDYLEIDLGSPQAVNYLYFEATQKPYDIELDYDLFDLAPARLWTPVKLVNGLQSITRLDYSVASRNPWKTIELHFTNSLDQMIYTRFLRIKLTRRNQEGSPFTNFDGSLEEYSIEVKNLRVARNVS